MKDYIVVDVVEYVKKLLESDVVTPRLAEKFARIVAREGVVGETVVSWSVDKDGKPIQERVDTVSIDEETGKPGWVVTKATENGDLIVDKNGNLNQWIIKDSVFKNKYDVENKDIGLYKPKGVPQLFIQIPENIILYQWGKETKIAAGGFINITNPQDMYGVSERDFFDTYKFVDEGKKNTLK